MKYLLLSLFFFTSSLYGLDAEAIRKIAGEPHSRDNLIDELKLYPNGREYKIKVRAGPTKNKLEAQPATIATEKTVGGRYIVSELKFPGAKNPLIMVVTYEKETDTFKKWILRPDGVVTTGTGVADFKKRTIAWVIKLVNAEDPITVLSIETHSDKSSTWKETVLQGGKVINLISGVAVKTK